MFFSIQSNVEQSFETPCTILYKTKSIIGDRKNEIKVFPVYSSSLKVFRENANFAAASVFRLLLNFAPRLEKAFWPLIVLRSVSDER